MIEFSTIEEALDDLKAGKMIVVVDDESRENEGDLIMPAETVTPEAMNFIAKYARGLICTPASGEILDRLKMGQMVTENTDNHSTAFTVSVDHVDTTTGISAYERAFTVLKMAEDDAKPEDFRRPGHVFPLLAREGGVLVRRGHTEATVDLARLAGFKPIGICCEIMSEDGHMARLPELAEFAKEHELKLITVDALVEYIYEHDYPIELASEAKLPTEYGEFIIKGFVDKITGEHHIALTKGEFKNNAPVLLRVHSECMTGDAFGSLKCDCGNQLRTAMRRISENGSGALVYMRQEGRGIGLINKIKAYSLQEKGMDTVEANLALGFPEDMRNYNAAAQIIKDLGIGKIRLMTNNPDKITSLEKNGLEITERVPLVVAYGHEADFYMQTKKEKMNHII
ncbi:MAG: bifunctional 3,4-dihydroxy-2-butanone-4-phosphate synthase/GTP cyclohydrolase II [Firmicutes bacterium]|nr:bifunctional 3,4-dihydroxy-2-butanone-4-phosphate synthase/GTP cyclohydrolase II [Bacillota bacterium]